VSRHAQSVRRRFDAAADCYESRSSVQARVADRLMDLWPDAGSIHRILEAGCGTGLLTRRLAARFPGASIEALDQAPRMIEAARRRCPGLTWHATDLLEFHSDLRYDLIASNCSLHWVEPLGNGFRILRKLLAPDGRLVFSIMLDGTLGELRAARLIAAPAKPPLGRLPSLPEVRAALESGGWRVERFHEEQLEERHASARDFLRHIHEMGLTGGAVSRAPAPLARNELARVIQEYDRRHQDGAPGVKATYAVAYVSAVGAEHPPAEPSRAAG